MKKKKKGLFTNKRLGLAAILVLLVASIAAVFSPEVRNILTYRKNLKAAGTVPAHHKTVKPNGDGTYKISLDVTGDAETVVQKSNIIVIMDTSNSMNENTPNSSRSQYTYDANTYSAGNKYFNASSNGSQVYYVNGQWRTSQNANQGSQYTGTVWYQPTRISDERVAMESLVTQLLSNNDSSSTVLNDVVNMVEYRAERKGLDVIINVDEETPDCLIGDEVRIRQIIMNLLTNAVKYTEEGSVTLSVKGEAVSAGILLTLAVKDTGIGIHKEDMENLFSGFQRLDLQRNRNIEGTGLGLTITRRLADMMGGVISVDSRYGEGSVFTVTLPQKVASEEPIGTFIPGVGKRPDGQRYRESFTAPGACVLVVDDNEMNLFVTQSLLKATRMQMELCKSGQECLDRLAKKHFDVVLLDQMMPGLDGIETLRRAKKLEGVQETPFIAMTANAVSGAREMFLKEGFADYISKPVDGILLERLVRKFLPEDKEAAVRFIREHHQETMILYDAMVQEAEEKLAEHPVQ